MFSNSDGFQAVTVYYNEVAHVPLLRPPDEWASDEEGMSLTRCFDLRLNLWVMVSRLL